MEWPADLVLTACIVFTCSRKNITGMVTQGKLVSICYLSVDLTYNDACSERQVKGLSLTSYDTLPDLDVSIVIT